MASFSSPNTMQPTTLICPYCISSTGWHEAELEEGRGFPNGSDDFIPSYRCTNADCKRCIPADEVIVFDDVCVECGEDIFSRCYREDGMSLCGQCRGDVPSDWPPFDDKVVKAEENYLHSLAQNGC